MAEQDFEGSTDSPSNTESVQNTSPLPIATDYHELHALLRRSLSTKLNIPAVPSNSSSTSSLTFYCIETGSVAQSIRRRQSLSTGTNVTPQTTTTTTTNFPLAEGHSSAHEDDDSKIEQEEKQQQQQQHLTDVDRSYPSSSQSDNDSFNHIDRHDDDDDDDDETIVDYSLHTESFPIPANYVSSPCPICFEQAVLQVSPCCYFLCCNHCWRAHISAAMNDGRIKIPCVASDCSKYLTRESIVNFVRYDPPLHDRYLKLYLNANQNPRAKTCPRCCHLYSLDVPTPTSKDILSNKTKKKFNNKKIPKQVQCSECSLVWCFRCSAPWHENFTCKQFIKGDKLLLKWINQKNEEQWNARKCPKCSSLIQRAGGCPHMTCQSCSCEFCYLCGRRYVPIPFIGQHSNKFSMFGCPYNFYPEKPWLRRTIRGMIATGVVVASPVIVAGAVTAAVTVLPPLGIYKLVKFLRTRRQSQMATTRFPIGEPFLIEPDLNDPHILPHATFPFDLHRELEAEEIMLVLRQRMAGLTLTPPIDEVNEEQQSSPPPPPQQQQQEQDEQIIDDKQDRISLDVPLAISADLGLEELFNDDSDKSASVFRTCPTTPACHIRKGFSRSLNNIFDASRHQRILTRQQSMMIKY